jgi:predicted dehydrogenase
VKIGIVGGGDVVARRLVPALLRSSFRLSPGDIHPCTLDLSDSLGAELSALGVPIRVFGSAGALIDELTRAGSPVFVCTPSDAHYEYYAPLAARSVRCAVEKPLSTVPEEIAAFEAELVSGAPSLFALSYYALEKALPVTYALSPLPAFHRFLEWEGAEPMTASASAARTRDWMERLGHLRALRIDVLEGVDRSPRPGLRQWTERGAGLVFEMLIHPLILARNFVAASGASLAQFRPRATLGTSALALTRGATTFARLDGAVDGISLTLTCGKYIHPSVQRRRGVAIYTSGRVEFSFDTMAATFVPTGGPPQTLRVRDAFQGKYLIQSELTLEFFQNGWTSTPHDHREAQLDALRWILAAALPARADFTYVDGSEPPSRQIIEGPAPE